VHLMHPGALSSETSTIDNHVLQLVSRCDVNVRVQGDYCVLAGTSSYRTNPAAGAYLPALTCQTKTVSWMWVIVVVHTA
jgi:hypothetical protein